MLERIKVGALAMGVCYPIYLVMYGAVYLLGFATGYSLAAIAGLVALRMAWLFIRAAVRGRPVFEVPPEPEVTAPILALGPEPARPAPDDPVPVISDERRAQRTPPLSETRLTAGTQQV